MTVQVFDNNTAGAPALSNAAGALITLLDFILVTQLGWTKPFSGTNKAAYKQPAGSNGFYLRVEDSGTTAASPSGRGFETMSDVDTGTGPFPTVAQVAGNGVPLRKGDTSNNQWRCITDGKLVYFGARESTYGVWVWWVFGDFISTLVTDSYNTCLLGCVANSGISIHGASNYTTNSAGNYIARGSSQTGGSTPTSKVAGVEITNNNMMGGGGTTYPDPIHGGINLSPVWLVDRATDTIRGVLPGLWNILHETNNTSPFVHGDTFDGAGSLAGRQFLIQLHDQGYRKLAFETSSTWGVQ